jgi:hypothetical protein
MSAQLAAASLVDFQYPSTPAKRPSAKLSRHARCCTICRHAERLEIEDDFLHWRASTEIAADYGLPDRRAVYRHARAAGLYQRRMKNMRVACSYIAEHAERVTPNAKHVLDAVRACSIIDATGTWHEPIRHIIVEHVNAAPETVPSTAQNSDISTVYSMQLESPATPTKQTPPTTPTVYSSAEVSNANSMAQPPMECGGSTPPFRNSAPPTRTMAEGRPTTPSWLKLCPDFIRDRFEARRSSGKAVSSHRTP